MNYVGGVSKTWVAVVLEWQKNWDLGYFHDPNNGFFQGSDISYHDIYIVEQRVVYSDTATWFLADNHDCHCFG